MKNWKKKLRPLLVTGCIVSLLATPILAWGEMISEYSFYIVDEDEGWEEDNKDATASDWVETATASNMASPSNMATPSNLLKRDVDSWPFDESEGVEGGLYYYNDAEVEILGTTTTDITEVTGADLIEDGDSPDGSAYFKSNTGGNPGLNFEFTTSDSAVISDFCVWEMDIRFDDNLSGFTPKNQAVSKVGNLGTCVRRKDEGGKSYLAIQTSGSAYSKLKEISPDSWYRIALRGFYGKPKSSGDIQPVEGSFIDLYIAEYDENGMLGEVEKFENVNRRNDTWPRRLYAENGTSIDNVLVYAVAPGKVEISALNNPAEIFAKNTLQFTTKILTSTDEAMPVVENGVRYEVYRSDGSLLLDGVTVSDTGLMTVAGDVAEQDIKIRAISRLADSAYGEYGIHIKAIDSVVIEKLGFNEDFSQIVNITANINQEFETGIVFIVSVYDQNGVMKKSYSKALEADDIDTSKVMKININGDLPTDFNKDTDTIKVFVWEK